MDRVTVLEAQMQALSAAWLNLAALMEMDHGLDRQRLTSLLRVLQVEDQPVFQQTLHQLCDQLDRAAGMRRSKARWAVPGQAQAR